MRFDQLKRTETPEQAAERLAERRQRRREERLIDDANNGEAPRVGHVLLPWVKRLTDDEP